MAQNKLTDRIIKAATFSGEEFLLGDGKSLNLRVRKQGKSWTFDFTSPVTGNRRRKSLGQYPTMDLKSARDEAERCRKLMLEGKDPIIEDEQAQLAHIQNDSPRTVQELFDRWRKHYLQHERADQGVSVKRNMEIYVLPYIGSLELVRMKSSHIVSVLQKVKDTGKHRTTAVVISNIKQMMSYAIGCSYLEADPTALLKKRHWAGKKIKRDRRLSLKELFDLAKKVALSDLRDYLKSAIWLILALGTRIEETVLIELEHIDLESRCLTIPKENQKQVHDADGKPLNVDRYIDLSDFAINQIQNILQENKKDKVDSKYLLASRSRQGRGHINEKTLTHAITDRQITDDKSVREKRTKFTTALVLDGGHWTPHDLRRTTSSMMRELGAPSDVVDRCIGHIEGNDLIATYQVVALQNEMKNAWEKIGQRLQEIHDKAFPIDSSSESEVNAQPHISQPDLSVLLPTPLAKNSLSGGAEFTASGRRLGA